MPDCYFGVIRYGHGEDEKLSGHIQRGGRERDRQNEREREKEGEPFSSKKGKKEKKRGAEEG